MPTLINTALISFMLIDIRRLLSGKGKLSRTIAAQDAHVNVNMTSVNRNRPMYAAILDPD
ncbi:MULTISPECIES: hypothetical protein [Sorangium]|uniref:hypothetical protein n=1 Tax=Sorangium TaxID=39643 RepID=UPI0013ED114B|nr:MULTISPECIES: hypothetical protein [Sorangium]